FELADRYNDPYAAQRALDLAWTSAQVELRDLNLTPVDAAVFQELAGHLFFSHPALRAPQEELRRNRGSQPVLWTTGVSGDWPILLATIDSADGLPTLRQLFGAHRYWRRHGMMVDLVVVDAEPPSYVQELHDRVVAAMLSACDATIIDRPGGVHVRRRDLVGEGVLPMLRATARVHIPCDGRSLGQIMDTVTTLEGLAGDELTALPAPPRAPGRGSPLGLRTLLRLRARALDGDGAGYMGESARREGRPSGGVTALPAFENGFGRLRPDGDYEMRVAADHVPPAPWANVVANRHGGFLVTERGGQCTWAESSQFFRLTPWHNDPVSDPASEVVYLQDEETGELWCTTPGPIREDTPYT
ncbi:MAG: hypothetical protein ACRDSN_20010, partial [Pseudonocardiaceae bacterium]